MANRLSRGSVGRRTAHTWPSPQTPAPSIPTRQSHDSACIPWKSPLNGVSDLPRTNRSLVHAVSAWDQAVFAAKTAPDKVGAAGNARGTQRSSFNSDKPSRSLSPWAPAASSQHRQRKRTRSFLSSCRNHKIERAVNAPDGCNTEGNKWFLRTHARDEEWSNEVEQHARQIRATDPEDGTNMCLKPLKRVVLAERHDRNVARQHVQHERAKVAAQSHDDQAIGYAARPYHWRTAKTLDTKYWPSERRSRRYPSPASQTVRTDTTTR